MNFVNRRERTTNDRDKRPWRTGSRPLVANTDDLLPRQDQDQYHHVRRNQSAVDLSNLRPAVPFNQFGSFSGPQQLPPRYPVVQQHNWMSTTNLPQTTIPPALFNSPPPNIYAEVSSRDVVGDMLSDIISRIDEDSYTETSGEVVLVIPSSPPPAYSAPSGQQWESTRGLHPYLKPEKSARPPPNRSVNVLAKLSQYSNSRLPASLPPFRVYLSTYPLLCLAALCSANAYHYRQNASKDEQLVSADARIGTKAMVVKSVTCADEKTIVFAIRGTAVLSLRDWNVNLNTKPESPAGFLDDEGNYCHAGFLQVAKAMVKPIATRLRYLLEENPNRLSYSLLITGHSAGGAVASLLYAHMMSEHVKSELTNLVDCFKRVHCVTFGAPPITLLPLRKPPNKEHKLKKCLFHSFINEGDPVVRAEKNYIMSLVDLLTTTPASASSLVPHANTNPNSSSSTKPTGFSSSSLAMLKITNLGIFTGQKKPKHSASSHNLNSRPHRKDTTTNHTWAVPPGTLSNAGRLVVLRGPEPPAKGSASQVDLTTEFEQVRAFTVTDEEIRKVIFGDPLMHGMEVYRRRIEALAMKAVTGREKYY